MGTRESDYLVKMAMARVGLCIHTQVVSANICRARAVKWALAVLKLTFFADGHQAQTQNGEKSHIYEEAD